MTAHRNTARTARTARRLRLSSAVGALALAASAFLGAVAVFGEAKKGCLSSGDCDRLCGPAPTTDGTTESLDRLKNWLDCRFECTMEIFDCRFPSPGGSSGLVLQPADGDPDKGPFVRPDLVAVDFAMVIVTREQGISSADVNGDGIVDVSDASRLLNYLFLGGAAPAGILINGLGEPEKEPVRSADGRQLIVEGDLALSAGDTDGNGRLDIADAVVILRFLFGGGEAPVEILVRRVPTSPTNPPVRQLPPSLPPNFAH